ncbi:hypothetical protein BU16DRAFT_580278 [Lophium mytilinum]|uniref:Uncharacterized protein n=1 Tax=Lophium mytilinum TaxID=390894 RepID=A0A6A6R082_9PEZI|nr:hypothetical protein BU16DRAFT_580278 [Lophium mytilinum]
MASFLGSTQGPATASHTVLGAQSRINYDAIKQLLVTKKDNGEWETMVLLDSTETQSDENRLCHQPATKLHKLVCGHWVFTKEPEKCAPNCLVVNTGKVPTTASLAPDFGCRLCERRNNTNDPSILQDPTSWPELLLEKYHLNVFTEASSLGSRACMIVYLAVDGTLIPCVDNVDAAVIRVLMSKHDDRGNLVMLQARPDVLSLLNSQRTTTSSSTTNQAPGMASDDPLLRNVPTGPRSRSGTTSYTATRPRASTGSSMKASFTGSQTTPTKTKAMRSPHTSPTTAKRGKDLTGPKRGQGVTKSPTSMKTHRGSQKTRGLERGLGARGEGQYSMKGSQRHSRGGDEMEVGEGLPYGDEGVKYIEGEEEGEMIPQGTVEEEKERKKLRETEKIFGNMALD